MLPCRRDAAIVVALSLSLALTACEGSTAPSADAATGERGGIDLPVTETEVQVLAINDFHGRLDAPVGRDGLLETGEPGPGEDGVPGTPDDGPQLAGGAAHLARALADRRADFGGNEQDSLTLAAGDLVGASTFASAHYQDEPTIEVLDALGLDFSAVGNHEFDFGKDELFRLSGATDGQFSDDVEACDGVDPGTDGCFRDSEGTTFSGSSFGYLAANVRDTATGDPVLPPYAVVSTTGGTRIGIIGVVTRETLDYVRASAVDGLTIEPPAAAANRYAAELQDRGVEAIVLLAHEGGVQSEGVRPDTCAGDLAGTPAGRLNADVSPAVDAIVGGHTHAPYTCTLADPAGRPRPVTQAATYGRSVTDLRLVVGVDGDVDRERTRATAVPVLRTDADPRVESIVDHWVARAQPEGDRVVGEVLEDIRPGPEPESPMGVLVADALLAAVQDERHGRPVLAFTTVPMLRAGLLTDDGDPPGAAGVVTYRDVFRALPFGFRVETLTVTGAAIHEALEHQFTRGDAVGLSTSGGLTYRYDPALPAGDRVDPCSVRLHGTRIEPEGRYRVAMTAYLRQGGEGYTSFAGGEDVVRGASDRKALLGYLEANSPVTPPALGAAVPTDQRSAC
ncbi:bifunctional metallophosphatase/5'-nucleotidase [Blastococcus montanus]|uniref:bifunctional metallophosphatase/5'-nucleotidase n=1 Tax=Blastococcus montanus TaxID=3144973 RepID=UPI00320B125C